MGKSCDPLSMRLSPATSGHETPVIGKNEEALGRTAVCFFLELV